jgi:hypothetical protein
VLVFWFWREIVLGVTYVLSVQYSCAVMSVFWLWREIDLKMRTRFYKKILLGYFNTRCAWRGLEELFFQLWFCVSFWFWQEIGFGFTYLCTYSTIQVCGVVLVFLLWWEIVFGVTYILMVTDAPKILN